MHPRRGICYHMSTGNYATDVKALKQSRNIAVNLVIFTGLFSFYYIFVFITLPQSGISDNLLVVQALFIFTAAITILLVSHLRYNLKKKHITIFSIALIVTLPSLLLIRHFHMYCYQSFLSPSFLA
jgi:hypothetical protein